MKFNVIKSIYKVDTPTNAGSYADLVFKLRSIASWPRLQGQSFCPDAFLFAKKTPLTVGLQNFSLSLRYVNIVEEPAVFLVSQSC